MASPQVENGYTRIANELFDAILCADLGKRQAKVLWAVIRLTYGFNKKSDTISFFQIAKMTGMDKSHAGRAVKELAGRSILTLEQSGRYERGQELYRIGVNKDHSQWETVANLATVANSAPVPNQQRNGCQISNGTVANSATVTVAKTAPTKDRKTGKTGKTGGARGAHRLPKGWGPTEEVRQQCVDMGLSDDAVDWELEKFRDHWMAATKNASKKDWGAAFRNWCRKAVEFKRERQGSREAEEQEEHYL